MDFFGIGPLEFLLILLLGLLLFNPKDLAGGARKLGQTLNRLYRSNTYQMIQKTSAELRELPQRLAHEAALEELKPTSPPTTTDSTALPPPETKA